MKARDVKKLLKPAPEVRTKAAWLSTGSTLLNLALSGRMDGGIAAGSYVFLVGDSASGKTFISLTCFAEAVRSKRFRDHRLIYDNVEGGALMDWTKFFGAKVAEKVEPPSWTQELAGIKWPNNSSETVESFYFHLDDAIKDGKPFVYVLDSMDALTTEDEEGKFAERKEAARKGKEVGGSYGTSKAKANSAFLRKAIQGLQRTGSILIIISQTRDNIGFGSQFNPKVRSGGHALRFYSTCEVWSSIRGKVRRNVKGKDRELGIIARLEVKKNRLQGKLRTVEVPILHSTGIDDVGSCVDWMTEEGFWKEDKGVVRSEGLGLPPLRRDALVRKIESDCLERELRFEVGRAWDELEAACDPKRKPRYT